MIHLDTSFVVDLLREATRKGSGPATALLEELPREEVRISVFVTCELIAGVHRSSRPEEEREKLQRFCGALQTTYPDDRFPEVYGAVLNDLYQQRINVATMDLLIATAALVDRARLVTGNPRHFSHISGLELLTYEKPPSPTLDDRPTGRGL